MAAAGEGSARGRRKGDGLLSYPEVFAYVLAVAVLAGVLAYRLAAASRDARMRKLQGSLQRFEQGGQLQRRTAEELCARLDAAEARVRQLERSIVEIPEIAQRLSATRDLREIPEKALDLVQEVFQPLYSVFYRTGRDGLVAAAVRGESEFAVGHRLKAGEGIVGWTAVKQLPYTPEDMRFESGLARGTHLAKGAPEKGFSLCLPVTSGSRTLGVILIGPCERVIPHWREIGRTIALITSVVITSATVLKEQKLLAKTDGLTGLMNRTHLLARVKDLLAADPGPRTLGVFLFDIDHFKHYNDTNGHLPGDELLKSLSQLLRDNIREGELVGRYGGEEFIMVMPNVDRDEAVGAAERIRRLIAEQPFPHADKQPAGRVTVSGGIAVWPMDGGDVDTLLRQADEALYAAKRAGRNQVTAWRPVALGGDPEPEAVDRAVAQALLADDLAHEFASHFDAELGAPLETDAPPVLGADLQPALETDPEDGI
jgi:diguanylate cyclase (GGDEF)-like protein